MWTVVSFTLTVCMTAMMGAAKPAIRYDEIPVTSVDSTTPLPLGVVSYAVEAGKTATPNNTTDMTVDCTDTKSAGEVFRCILEGLSESIFVQAGVIILLLALFILVKVVCSKTCRNGRKPAAINNYENKKMITHQKVDQS